MFTKTKGWMIPATVLALAVGVMQMVPSAVAEGAQNDTRIQAEITKALSNKEFKDVQASVQNGIVSLTGTVNVYAVKADAEKKAHKLKSVMAVRHDIKIGGPSASMRFTSITRAYLGA